MFTRQCLDMGILHEKKKLIIYNFKPCPLKEREFYCFNRCPWFVEELNNPEKGECCMWLFGKVLHDIKQELERIVWS